MHGAKNIKLAKFYWCLLVLHLRHKKGENGYNFVGTVTISVLFIVHHISDCGREVIFSGRSVQLSTRYYSITGSY
jgi:hypothetical protein